MVAKACAVFRYIYGLNRYGIGANYLSAELEKRNIDKPYILTEFGVAGEWDIKEEKMVF